MLLCRPWQYDKKFQHNGFKNTYSFVKDGVNVILDPSKSRLIPKPSKGEKTFLITSTKMEKLVNDVNIVYALIVF
jgi:hypothetical protein